MYSVLEISRVPCVGEYVRPDGKRIIRVSKVIHSNNTDGTVACVILED